jgi:two-component sensor histidine kinase
MRGLRHSVRSAIPVCSVLLIPEPQRADGALGGDLGMDCTAKGPRGWRSHVSMMSLRLALPLLILAALAPAAAFVAFDATRVYKAELYAREAHLLQTSRLLIDEHHGPFISARALLRGLAALPQVRSFGDECGVTVKAALRGVSDPGFAAIGVVDSAGRWRCGSETRADGLDVSDRRWFADVRNGRRWVVSELLDSRLVAANGVILAVPIVADSGSIDGAIALMLRAERFARTYRSAALGEDAVFVLLDRDGQPVTGGPDAGGIIAALPRDTAGVVQAARTGSSQLAEARDGRQWVYAVVPLFGGQLRALSGISADTLYGPANEQLLRRLGLPLLLLVLAAVLTWIGVDRLLLKWLRRVRATTSAYAAGMPSAPISVAGGAPAEFRELTDDLARMADRIGSREQALRESLANRELLVREVHHRVKNSLQMVTSLLSLHARRAPPGEARRGFEDAGARLSALAVVHQRLCETEQLEAVRLDEFLRDLCSDLHAGRPPGKCRIEVVVAAVPVTQPSAVAVPLGLLVNEVVINAYKHAFLGREQGRIDVRLDQVGSPDRLVLTIRDDGIGSAPRAAAPGLGTTLIQGFARQLSGTVEYTVTVGTEVRVEFPMTATDNLPGDQSRGSVS